MPYVNDDFDCCGLAELGDIREHEAIDAVMKIVPNNQGIVIFTDIEYSDQGWENHNYDDGYDEDDNLPPKPPGYEYGKKLAAFIKTEKLGGVSASKIAVNPNTLNKIKMWTWIVDRDKLAAFQTKMREAQPNRWRRVHYDW